MVIQGSWYPDLPPRPDGMTDDEWVAVLADDARSPFDHARKLRCATGFHTGCIRSYYGDSCGCPCHGEPVITPYDAVDVSAVHRLSHMRHVPIRTARRILAHAQRAAESGEATTKDEMQEVLEDVYGGSPIGDAFLLDVLSLLDYSKVPEKGLRK